KWVLSDITCTSIGQPPITVWTKSSLPVNAPTSGSVTFNLNTASQQDATCTFTNSRKPTLTLTKIVHNNFGGSAVARDFTFHVSGTHVLDTNGNPVTSTANLKDGDKVIMDSGAPYSVTEDSFPGYEVESVGNGCAGSLTFNQNQTCTITNKDIQPKI